MKQISVRKTIDAGWRLAFDRWKTGLLITVLMLSHLVVLSAIPRLSLVQGLDPNVQMALQSIVVIAYFAVLLIATVFYVRLFMIGEERILQITSTELALNVFALTKQSLRLLIPFVLLYLPVVVLVFLLQGTVFTQTMFYIFAAGIFLYFVAMIIFATVVSIGVAPSFIAAAMGQDLIFRDCWTVLKTQIGRIFLALLPSLSGSILVGILCALLLSFVAPYLPQRDKEMVELIVANGVLVLFAPALYMAIGTAVAIICEIYKAYWPEQARRVSA